MDKPRTKLRPIALLLLLWGAVHVWAQEEGDTTVAPAKAVLRVVPRVTVSETFTDNVDLGSSGNRRSEQITEVAPGIHISQDSGRINGFFDYALRVLGYSQGTHDTSVLHALSSVVRADALNHWLFIDFSGDITQQSVSALGPQPGGAGFLNFGNGNFTEFSRYSLSPFVQGSLGEQVNYVARVSRAITHSNAAQATDVGESQAALNLSSSTALGRLGWVADASRYDVDYSAGRATEADLVDLGVSLAFTPQLLGVAKVGRESSNYTSVDKQQYDTHDLSLSWRPSAAVHASAAVGHRSFGDTHALDLEYHTPLVNVRLGSRRDISAVPGQVLPVLLVPAQGPAVVGNFVTTAVAVQNRQDLSVSLQGVRDTVTLGLSQSDNQRLDTLANTVDSLSSAAVHQTGVNLEYSHRLTPRHTLGAQAGWQKATASAGQADSQLQELSLNLQSKLWRNGLASVGVRRAVFTGATPYEENALTLRLTAEF